MNYLRDINLEVGKCYRLKPSRSFGAYKHYDRLIDELKNGNFYYREKIDILVLEIFNRKDRAGAPTEKLVKVLLDGQILFIYGGNYFLSYEQLV